MSLPESVAQAIDSNHARVGLSVIDLKSGSGFGVNEDEVFAQASAIKIPILWTLHRLAAKGELSLDQTLPIDPTNGSGGCGVLQNFASRNTQVALGDLAVLMIVLSDNVATNLLIDRLGFEAVNGLLGSLGSAETRLRRKMIDQAARNAGRENTSTPAEAARLMQQLDADNKRSDPVAAAVLKTLRLKKTSPVTAALPEDTRLATKPGMLGNLRTEWSLVETDDSAYAMTLMADGADDSELEPLFRNLAAAIHEVMMA